MGRIVIFVKKNCEEKMEKDLLQMLLPAGLLDYFLITKIEEIENKDSKEKVIYTYLEEINQIPSAYDSTQYESKGFYAEKTIQDFPIRGKAVYLKIKRRRWRHKQNKREIQNDYTFIAEGSKITKELSDFLKSTD